MARYKVNKEFGVEVGGEKYDLGKSFDTAKLTEKQHKLLEKQVEKGEVAEDFDIDAAMQEFEQEMYDEVTELADQGFIVTKDEPDEEPEPPAPKAKGKKGGKGK